VRITALVRGVASVADLKQTLDELQVKDGEHFIIANSAALNPSKPGFCVCDRPLQGTLFAEEPVGQKPADAVVSG
jgi:hypothetical protein